MESGGRGRPLAAPAHAPKVRRSRPQLRATLRRHLLRPRRSVRILAMNWRDHIVSDPQVLRGKPCVKGTRIPVALILGYLAAGRDVAAIQREFPDLAAADVAACLDYARELAEIEAVRA